MLLLLLVILVVVGFFAYPDVWYWLVRRFVNIEIQIDKTWVEIDETVSLTCVITNRAWLSIPRLKLMIPLPEGLVATGTDDHHYLNLRTTLGARERITSIATCRAKTRGVQTFTPAEVVLSEGFGIKNIVVQQSIPYDLAVLPKLLSRKVDTLRLRSVLGSIEVERWLHPDESLYKGTRPYQSGDPYKHIAWLSSATSGQWMVKQFSTSSDATVHLVLNAQFNEDHWAGVNQEEFDELCSSVATVAQILSKRGLRLHFWTNAIWSRYGRRLSFGRQSADGIRCLLAELRPITSASLSELIEVLLHRPDRQEDVLLFTPYLSVDHVRRIQTQAANFVIVSPQSNAIAIETGIRHLSV